MAQRVLISHSAPRDFHGTPNWSKVCNSITSQLPLRNVNLRSPLRGTTITVASLDVALVPLESIREETASQVPTTLLEKPLLHLYIVYCQVSSSNIVRILPPQPIPLRTMIWRHTEQSWRRRWRNGWHPLHKRRTRSGSYSRSSVRRLEPARGMCLDSPAPLSASSRRTSLPTTGIGEICVIRHHPNFW